MKDSAQVTDPGAVVGPIEIETWLNREAIERSADSLAFDLERPRWQRYPLGWSHALELNSPNDRTVAVSPGPPRTIKTIEREDLSNSHAPRRLGITTFR